MSRISEGDRITEQNEAIDALTPSRARPSKTDGVYALLKAHNASVYEVDFGEDGKESYVRFSDFQKIVAALTEPRAGDGGADYFLERLDAVTGNAEITIGVKFCRDLAALIRRLTQRTEAAPRDEGAEREPAWRDLVLRAWTLLDVECPNDPITDELFAALKNTAAQRSEGDGPQHGNWIAADDVNRLVRKIDVAINGVVGAAPQAALCDIASQIIHSGLVSPERATAAEARILELEAALVQCYTDSGADTTHMPTNIAPAAVQAVADLRRDYQDSLTESTAAEAVADRLRKDAEMWKLCNSEHALTNGEVVKAHVIVGINVEKDNKWQAFYQCSPDELTEALAAIQAELTQAADAKGGRE